MNKNITLIALTTALSLLTPSVLAQENAPGTGSMSHDNMTNTATGTMSHDTMMHDGMMKGYVPYTKDAYDKSAKMQRVLFFHATWCPMCKAANADITKNIAQLPKNVVIFKVDYDKETALKKKYGITMQHTFVLVDAAGKALKKWSGGGMKEIAMNTGKGM